MKNHIAIITTILLLTILINITAVTNAANAEKNTETPTQIEKAISYILKDYNGRIALFEAEATKPLKVYNIFTDSLPHSDAEMIKNGITVTSNELEKILEEYTS